MKDKNAMAMTQTNKKRVLLINPPASRPTMRDYYCSSSSKASYVWPPIDFVVQSGYLKGVSDLKIIDCALSPRRREESILSEAVRFAPDAIFALVGSAGFPEDFRFLNELRRKIDKPIVVSGDIVQFDPQHAWNDHPWISGVLRDFTSPALMEFVVEGAGENPWLWRTGDSSDLPESRDSFVYPLPAHAVFTAMGYRQPFLRGRFASVLTTYGCPHRCTYCNSGTLGFRNRELPNLVEELRAVRCMGVRELFFKDMTFNAVTDYTNRVLDKLIGEGFGFRFICYARPDDLDEGFARKLKRAGCRMVMLGIETGDNDLMESVKGLSVRNVLDACEAMDSAGLSYGGHFLVGLPGEDEGRFRSTLTMMRRIHARYASFNVPTPRFGSPWRSSLSRSTEVGLPEAMDCSTGVKGFSSVMDTRRIERKRKRAIMAFYLRPSYLGRMVFSPRHWLDLPGFFSNAVGLFGDFFTSGPDDTEHLETK